MVIVNSLAALLVASLLNGCAAPSTQAKQPVLVPVETRILKTVRESGHERAKVEESPSIYSHGSDDWVPSWSPTIPPLARFELDTGSNTRGATTRVDTVGGDSIHIHLERGFRVQLANVLSEDQARSIEQRAKAIFDQIYITFRSPNYKVRAGDFTSRADADRAAVEAKRLGFRGAWVVPDRVYVKD